MQYQRKHKYKNYNSLITNACVGFAVDCQPENIEWEKEQKVHASLERSLRENLTAKRFFYGFFLIVFLNFWNVKWLNSAIAAF